MATINPQKREEARYTGGITGASTVNSTYADGSNAPILSGQSLATAMFGSGSPAVTFDYSSPKTSVAKRTTTRSATPTAAPKSTVSSSVANAKAATAAKVASRVQGDSYSSPTKAAPTSRADSASNNKPAPKAMTSNTPKPKASVNKMYEATYGRSLPKKSSGPERNFEGHTAAQVAAINKRNMDAVAREKANPPKPKAKKPVSSSVSNMYKATYGTKLK